MEIVPLSAAQADALHQLQATIGALEATIESLRSIGSVRGVQSIEAELSKERRKERQLLAESPAVAEAFLHSETCRGSHGIAALHVPES